MTTSITIEVTPREKVSLVHQRALEMSSLLSPLIHAGLRWSSIYSLMAPKERGFGILSTLSFDTATDKVLTEDLLVRGRESDSYHFLCDILENKAICELLADDAMIGNSQRSTKLLTMSRNIVFTQGYLSHALGPWESDKLWSGDVLMYLIHNNPQMFSAYHEAVKEKERQGATLSPGDRFDLAASLQEQFSPLTTVNNWGRTDRCMLAKCFRQMQLVEKLSKHDDLFTVGTGYSVEDVERSRDFSLALFNAQEHFTPAKAREFTALVEEYNLEWAMAAFEWCPEEGSQVIKDLTNLALEMPW